MLAFRLFMAVGAGVLMTLGYATPAMSQFFYSVVESTPSGLSENSRKSAQVSPLQIAARPKAIAEDSIAIAEQLNFLPSLHHSTLLWSSLPNFQQFNQVATNSPIRALPNGFLDTFRPNANPLQFPTTPAEVEIDLTQPITLAQALELARRNNQELRVAQLNLEAAGTGLQEALAGQSPTVLTRADLTRRDNLFFGTGGNQDRTVLGAGIELNYDLLTGGRRNAQIRAAEEQVRFSQLDYERVAEQLRFQVASQYYNLQEAGALVEVAQSAVEDATRSLRDAQLLEQAGLGTRFDVLRAEVQVATATQDLTQATAEQIVSRRALVEILGIRETVDLTAADPIERVAVWQLSLPESIVLAYRNRAELEQQLSLRTINEQQQAIALAATRPQVSLFSSYNLSESVRGNLQPADGLTLGARVQWLLVDGGAAQARANREQLNIEIAETRFDDQRNQIRLEVEQGFFRLQANDANIGTATAAVRLAEESLRLARLRFQAGVGTQTDVISAQAELTAARANQVRAVIDYNRSFSSLTRAVSNFPDTRLFNTP